MDGDRLGILFSKLNRQDAEDMIGRAVEELAVRLSQCEVLWRHRDVAALRKSVRSLIAIADQIGMCALARCAEHVITCLDMDDRTAIAATLARLVRVGDASLNAMWDLQDMSV